jgi:hypothetical protein
MNAMLRYAGVTAVLAFYVFSALSSLEPGSMFAGLAPLTLIAAEAVWCLFRVSAEPQSRRHPYGQPFVRATTR